MHVQNHTKKVLVLTQKKNAFYNFFSNPEGIAQLIKGFISNNFKIIIICRNEEKGSVFLHDVEKSELNLFVFSYIHVKKIMFHIESLT